MIFGIGVDVLEAARIGKVYARFGEHFVDRLLLPGEREQMGRTKRKERFLAMRFAAKEAIVKAMGTGFVADMWIRDVGVVRTPGAAPRWCTRRAVKRCGRSWDRRGACDAHR